MQNSSPEKPLEVLVSAYACGPNRGSEIGMGWNWVTALARRCRLTVITEAEFDDERAPAISKLDLLAEPVFHSIDIGEAARSRCWNQGDWRFYSDYRVWQRRAHDLAKRLLTTQRFDLVHQLNMIGYREPGYLWRLALPFVWGPVGGHVQMPVRFLPTLGLKGAAYHVLRNLANAAQMRMSPRVRKAARRASVLIASTPDDASAMARLHDIDTVVLNETGSDPGHPAPPTPKSVSTGDTLRIVWCGKFASRKALPLALRALARAEPTPMHLDIVGTGPGVGKLKALASELNIAGRCTWHGRVPHAEALRLISENHCMLLSSLQEAATTVVMEALSCGIPVICHDTCGFGEVVNSRCGLKVPLVSPTRSISGFAQALQRLAREPDLLSKLSEGATDRAQEFAWDRKSARMESLYRQALSGQRAPSGTTSA